MESLSRPASQPAASVMIWTLKGSLEERLEAAAAAGFQSIEFVGEYAGWTDSKVTEVKRLCQSFGLGIDMLLATPAWDQRPVSMLDPDQRDNFLADVRNAISYAQKLEVPEILLLSGNTIPGRTREEQSASLCEGAQRAGDLAADVGIILALEPINSLVTRKNFFLNTCSEGLEFVRRINHPNVKLLFDVYHEQVQAGNTIQTLMEAAPEIATIHVADNPGRNEPGSGEINYRNIYKTIRQMGFRGYVAMEYFPTGEQVGSLSRALAEFREVWEAPSIVGDKHASIS